MFASRFALFRGIHAAVAGAALLCALPAAPVSAQEVFSAEESEAIGAEVRRYILDHPEVIIEAMRILEERRRLADEDRRKQVMERLGDEIRDDGYSFVGGNPEGDITLVEFSDYRCGYCKRAHPHVRALLKEDPNIRYVVKEFPILGPDSVVAAKAAMAALELDDGEHYFAFNDALMTQGGALNRAAILRVAERVGLDADDLEEAMDAPEIQERIDRTYALAEQLGISGTPSFVVGQRIIPGYVEKETMAQIVAEQRSLAAN